MLRLCVLTFLMLSFVQVLGQLHNTANCGSSYRDSSSGVLTSPLYPVAYPNRARCEWVIDATPGNILGIRFTNFSLENHAICSFDYIEILDGNNQSLNTWCGDDLPPDFLSTTQTIKIRFFSDGSVSSSGFRLTYERYDLHDSRCGLHYLTSQGTLTSPNYPDLYPLNIVCNWTIDAQVGKVLNISFDSFRIEGSTGCPYDFVQIFQGDSQTGDKYCGRNTPVSFLSNDQRIRVEFFSDYVENFLGFSLTFFSQPLQQESCPVISIINSWTSNCTNGRNVSSVCTHECRNGYVLQGNSQSTCRQPHGESPDWSPSLPRCIGVCPRINLDNGVSTCSSGKFVNSRCTHRCEPNYRLVGRRVSSCVEQSGRRRYWSPPIPQCLAVCEQRNLSNGVITCGDGRNIGSTCNFRCNTDYELIGQSTFTCFHFGSNAIWFPSEAPRCQALAPPICPNVTITEGSSICTNQNNVGSVCSHQCSNGYEIVGNRSSECSSLPGRNAAWLPQLPYCRATCPPLSIPYGFVDCTANYSINSSCEVRCLDKFEVIGNVYTTCLARSSTTSGWNFTVPRCVPLCPAFNLLHGRSYCTRGTSVESSCSHSCDDDYVLEGRNVSNCFQVNRRVSSWSPRIPHCKALCPRLSLLNGRINCTNERRNNSECFYLCDDGYELIGENISRCEVKGDESASWTTITSTCRAFCPQIELSNGQSSCSNKNKVNSHCVHRCNTGFIRTGATSSRCFLRQDGTTSWRPSIPFCRGVCPRKRLVNGVSYCSNGRYVNSICTHRCRPNFRLESSNTSRCIELPGRGGMWSPSIPQCKAICEKRTLANGSTRCKDDRNIGSVCTHLCNEGFELIGENTSSCTNNSSDSAVWLPIVHPRCQAVCLNFNISHGASNCTRENSVGSVCLHYCDDDYTLSRSTFSRCHEISSRRAEWIPSIPECNALCPSLTLANGRINCTIERAINSECSFYCDDGYELIGQTVSRCKAEEEENANWSSEMPTCRVLCPIIELTNGKSSCSNGSSINSYCDHQCSNGFALLGSSSSRCLLQRNGAAVWSPDLPTCKGTCPSITLSNGIISCTNDTIVNSICSFRCNRNYKLGGSNESMCIEQSERRRAWSPSRPRCTAICEQRLFSNGVRECIDGRNVGSICTHRCNDGYQLFGHNRSTCFHIGSKAIWFPAIAPRCQRLAPICGNYRITDGSSICTNQSNIGSVCSHRCNNGFELVGDRTSECSLLTERNAHWFPGLPSCRATCSSLFLRHGEVVCSRNTSIGSSCTFSCNNNFELIGSSFTTCAATGSREAQWNFSTPYCTPVCPNFILFHGTSNCTKGNSIGSYCSHYCDDGYELEGQSRSRCIQFNRRNALWEPSTAKCEALCPQLSLLNGQMNCTNGRRNNSECYYTCDERYELIGESTSHCQVQADDGASWTFHSPTCRAICPSINIPDGSSTCLSRGSIDSLCQHQCNEEFYLLGSNSSRCILQNNGSASWSHTIPSCIGIPKVSENISYTVHPIGNKVTFSCDYIGYPLPFIQWKFYNRSDLPSTSQFQIEDQVNVSQYQTSKSMTVYGVSCKGTSLLTYGCSATNLHSIEPVLSGPFTSDIAQNASLLPLSIMVDECNGAYMSISWNILEGAVSIPHVVNISEYQSIEIPRGENNTILWNLKPETEYEIQVTPLFYGCNPSEVMFVANVTTGRRNLTQTPDIGMEYNYNENQCNITWFLPDSADFIGNIGQFMVNITENIRSQREDLMAMSSFVPKVTFESVNKSLNYFSFDNLKPNTDYKVELGVVPSSPCEGKIPIVWSSAVSGICKTNPSVPDAVHLSEIPPRVENGNLLITLQPTSERNGPISCYFVVIQKSMKAKNNGVETNPINLKQAGENITESDAFIAAAIQKLENVIEVALGDEQITCCNIENFSYDINCSESSTLRTRRAVSSSIIRGRSRVLPPGSNYTYYVIASVPSGDKTYYAASDRSKPFTMEVTEREKFTSDDSGFPLFIVIATGSILVLIVITAFFVLRYKRKACFARKGVYEPSVPTTAIMMSSRPSEHTTGNPDEQEPLYSIPIPTIGARSQFQEFTIMKSDFLTSYLTKRESHDQVFKKEYNKTLPCLLSNESISTKYAQRRENKKKNRDEKALPSDLNRVVLSTIAPDRFTDYINASLIQGFMWPSSFIAAQGPTSTTVADFWRMIVEQRCEIIVMVTKVMEDSLMKCDQYWPEVGEVETFGNISVTTNNLTSIEHYKRRELLVITPNAKPLQVSHFQFLSWPEHSSTITSGPLLRFKDAVVHRYAEAASGPMLVHGSAGCGRTSCFIALVMLSQELRQCNKVNVIEVVYKMRLARTGMLSKLDDYIFLHKLLADMVCCEGTDVEFSQFLEYFKTMKGVNESHVTRMKEQFGLLEKIPPLHEPTARMENKNEKEEKIVPYELTLVRTEPLQREKKPESLFVASQIESYKVDNYFLVAENPTSANTGMFWRCVIKNNIRCIVMLTQDESIPVYLAQDEHEFQLDDIQVCTKNCEDHFGYFERTLEVYGRNDPNPHQVQHITLKSWPQLGIPSDRSTIMKVIGRVKNYQSVGTDLPSKNYIALVHCSDGSRRSGVFCAVSNLFIRLDCENKADVFNAVKDLRACRHRMVGSILQYELCYQVIADFVEEFNDYQTFQ